MEQPRSDGLCGLAGFAGAVTTADSAGCKDASQIQQMLGMLKPTRCMFHIRDSTRRVGRGKQSKDL